MARVKQSAQGVHMTALGRRPRFLRRNTVKSLDAEAPPTGARFKESSLRHQDTCRLRHRGIRDLDGARVGPVIDGWKLDQIWERSR